ncbi:MAG: hypothetical protein AB9891_04545 [Anaerolineaceae bacterium]
MDDFSSFRQYILSFENRNKRLGLKRTSLQADLLKERTKGIGIDFYYLMQADFIAFMREEVETKDNRNHWWPVTLIYLGDFNKPFEIFVRAASNEYFDKVKVMLGIDKPENLIPLLNSYKDGSRNLPKLQWHTLNPENLLGFKDLCS